MDDQQIKYTCRYCSFISTDIDDLETDYPLEKGYWCPCCDTFNFFDFNINYNDPKLILENKLLKNASVENKKVDLHLNKYISPLRYPGGKSKLINLLYNNFNFDKKTFVDLYCGGASVGLSFLFSEIIDNLIMNDLDKGVYTLFHMILNNPDALIDRINNTKPNEQIFGYYRNMINNDYQDYSELDIAFGFLLVNRCAFSGIWNANSLSDITSRWNVKTLEKRILKIYEYRKKITLYNMNAIELLEDLYWNDNNSIFIDPPYVEKGSKLYHCYYNQIDHIELANMIRSLTLEHPGCADITVTYDDHELIHELYEDVANIKVISSNYSVSNK